MGILDGVSRNYNSKTSARRRRARSQGRKKRWKRKSTASKALIKANRALKITRRLEPPMKYIEWASPNDFLESNKNTPRPVRTGYWPICSRIQTATGITEPLAPRKDWSVVPLSVPTALGTSAYAVEWAHDTQLANDFNASYADPIWEQIVDIGSNARTQVDHVSNYHGVVAALSVPINAVPYLPTSIGTRIRIDRRTTHEIYSRGLRFNYDIQIQDAGVDRLQARTNKSQNVVHVHVLLVKLPVDEPCADTTMPGAREHPTVFNSSSNDNLRFLVQNMFKYDPLAAVRGERETMQKLQLRPGQKGTKLYDDEQRVLNSIPAGGEGPTYDPETNAHYARVSPFKVLAHKTYTLGSNSTTSSNMLAKYQAKGSFSLKLGKESFKDALYTDGDTSYQNAFQIAGSEYRVLVIHDGCTVTPYPTAPPTAASPQPTYGHNNVGHDNAARVYMKATVKHMFTDS